MSKNSLKRLIVLSYLVLLSCPVQADEAAHDPSTHHSDDSARKSEELEQEKLRDPGKPFEALENLDTHKKIART